MEAVFKRVVDIFASFHLAVITLALMTYLTWRGTLHQVDAGLFQSSLKFFECWGLIDYLGPFGIPLPGGKLLMLVLGVNLLVGGVVRMRRGVSTVGILITHLGILLMLIAGAVKLYASTEGNLRLWPGEQGHSFSSFHFWEVEVRQELEGKKQRVVRIDHDAIVDLEGDEVRVFDHAAWPFRIELSRFMRNAEFVRSSAPGSVEGVLLKEMTPRVEEEFNFAGLRVRALAKGASAGDGGKLLAESPLFGGMPHAFVFEVGSKKVGVKLQRRLERMPFSVRLDAFHHELYPNTNRARVFASDVTVLPDAVAGGKAPLKELAKIEMNQPLRRDGYILFQGSYGPKNARKGEKKFSVFQIVRNPSDQWPLWSCIIIAIGLLVHFGTKLWRWMKAERKRALAVRS